MLDPFAPAITPPNTLNLKNVSMKIITTNNNSTSTVPAGKQWRVLASHWSSSGTTGLSPTYNGIQLHTWTANSSTHLVALKSRRLYAISGTVMGYVYGEVQVGTTGTTPTGTNTFVGNNGSSGAYIQGYTYGAMADGPYLLAMNAGQTIVNPNNSSGGAIYTLVEEVDIP